MKVIEQPPKCSKIREPEVKNGRLVAERVHTAAQRKLGGQHPADLALQGRRRLAHEAGVVDQTVLRRLLFRL